MKTETRYAILGTFAVIAVFAMMLFARGASQSPPPRTPEDKALATARTFIEKAAVPVQPTAEVQIKRRSYAVLGVRPWVALGRGQSGYGRGA